MTISRYAALSLTLALAGAVLQGCAPKAPSKPAPRLYEADMKGGAKTCQTPKPDLVAGKVVEASMKVSSDRGWCGLPVDNAGQPYDVGLLTGRPDHGKVFVHRVGNDTRIDYTPEFGFAGTDGFTVRMLPGDAGVRVAVTVVPH